MQVDNKITPLPGYHADLFNSRFHCGRFWRVMRVPGEIIDAAEFEGKMLHDVAVALCALIVYLVASVPAAMLIGSMLRLGRSKRYVYVGPCNPPAMRTPRRRAVHIRETARAA